MKDSKTAETIGRIGQLARRDPGGRGLASHAPAGGLLDAAQSLISSSRVILVTGFCIRAAMIGETDGPPGTLALASALHQLGKPLMLVTDTYSAGMLQAGIDVLGDEFPLLSLDREQARADRQIDALLADFAPSHVVAIERPGTAIDGHCYSMRGERLDDLLPAADRLLVPPGPRNFQTIAIGDGGNELGMGSLRNATKQHVAHGELIFCVTPADHVVPAGISNWGAYALAAALSLLAGRLLIRPPAAEQQVLAAMVAAGAVDGITGRCEASVDGLVWPGYAATLTEIHAEVTRQLG